jgi:hypothetical protein
MVNRKDLLIRVFCGVVIIVLLTIIAIRKPHNMIPPVIQTCKEDSLISKINDLQIELENEQDGWDDKEKRYEQILFEYEFGLEHLKNYHTDSYREFHRIIGYKERFSVDVERENKKRLQHYEKDNL